MKIHFFIFCLVTFGGLNAAFSQTAQSKPVLQSWNEVQLILPLVRAADEKGKSIDKMTATFIGVMRIGRRNFDFLDKRAGLTLDFRVNKCLSLSTGGLYREDELIKNTRRFETRLNFGATLSKTWRDFSFRDRNMFEHRFRSGRIDANLYRQRFQTSHPLKHKNKLFFSPFISEEGYYDLKAGKWLQNEFFAGITRSINRKTSIDISYIRFDGKPIDVNGLSLSFKIKLR